MDRAWRSSASGYNWSAASAERHQRSIAKRFDFMRATRAKSSSRGTHFKVRSSCCSPDFLATSTSSTSPTRFGIRYRATRRSENCCSTRRRRSLGFAAPALLADIKWGLDRASQLSPYRNDAAHTAIWTVEQPTGKRAVFPDPRTSRSPSIQRLANTPTAAIWRKVRGDLYALSAYFDLIDAHARYGPLQPLRSRPAMQSIPTKTATPSRVRIQRGRARQPKA